MTKGNIMQIKRILQVSTAFTTAVALFSGATLTATATEAPNTNDSLHAEQIVDAARDALGIRLPTEQIVPDRLDSVLSYDSAEGVTTLTVDGQGVAVNPLAVTTSSSLFTIEDTLKGDAVSVTEDGSTVLSGQEADYVIDAYDDGSLRVQTVIESENSNHRVPFELNLNDDELAQIEPDGSIGFYKVFPDEGIQLLTSAIDKPWAIDALGEPVQTRFELDGETLIQIIEPDSTTAYPVTADPFWIPAIIAGLRVGVHVLIKVGSRVTKYAVAPASRVTNALKNFSTLNFRAGSNPVKLTKSRMKHILERHHPQYWNGTETATQSFFNPKMSVSGVRSLIHGALKKHSSSIKNLGTKRGEYFGTYNGVKYKLVVSNNQVVQFYPR